MSIRFQIACLNMRKKLYEQESESAKASMSLRVSSAWRAQPIDQVNWGSDLFRSCSAHGKCKIVKPQYCTNQRGAYAY